MIYIGEELRQWTGSNILPVNAASEQFLLAIAWVGISECEMIGGLGYKDKYRFVGSLADVIETSSSLYLARRDAISDRFPT